MFCPNCGAQNPDGAPKCMTCGQVLQSAGPKPQAKFKGTMLMTNDAAPRGPGVAPPPPSAAKGQFAKTMMGGMASIDPASLGGGMVAREDGGSDAMLAGHGGQGGQVEAARTIAMDAASFGLPGVPHGGGPVASPFPAPAAAPSFAQRPMTPPAREPDPSPTSSTDEDMGVASTIAVDSSSFGFDRDAVPGPGGPASFGQSPPQHQAPQHQAPHGGFGQQAPQQPPQHQSPQGGFAQPSPQGGFGQPQPPQHQAPQHQAQAVSSSTVAMDASAFGLGGPGAPSGPQGGFGQPAPQGGFGQQPGMQQGPGPGGASMFGGAPQHETGNIASTVAVDASAFGLAGMGGPGGPGMPPQGAYGQQQGMQQGAYGQQPGMQQGGYGQQPGMQQGGYGMQPGMQQGGYGMQPGMQQGGYGMQPGMQPGYGQPGMQPSSSGAGKVVLGIVLFVVFLGLAVLRAVWYRL